MTGSGPRPHRHRVLRWMLALAVLFLLSEAAAAGEPAVALDKPRLAQAPEPLCFCWNDGRKITEGAMSCIRTTQGRRVATCGRVVNMMSWQITETACPES
ncbi:MAG: hypothetical protein J0I42_17865 [Bosea sp.]|uniref:hypothetical protein n=1 Tax=Bosea sp. (in: a-proteobacteria) TaxID=1871050 RepID=UPI001AC78AFC|nr:hypothetical protein [Bosea sp. (in: a-proteobacteria)]MBN9453809.1 hypothetical protein [Bosea sp. (in: a-proteobacteria)]